MRKDKKTRTGQHGFSLIELIVVLVILGLLATIVGPRLIGRLSEGKVKITQVQLAELGQALDLYRFDVGRYPTSAEGLEALNQNPGVQNWSGPYLKKNAIPKDPWGREYHYRSPGLNGEYDLYSLGADGVEGGEGDNEDITSW